MKYSSRKEKIKILYQHSDALSSFVGGTGGGVCGLKVISRIRGEVMVNSSYPEISFPLPKSERWDPLPISLQVLGFRVFLKKRKISAARLCWRLSRRSGPRAMRPPASRPPVLKSKQFHVEAGNVF